MKRLLCLLLTLLLTLSLFGCVTDPQASAQTARFYYCRSDFSYGEATGVITPETRDTSDIPSEDLNALLELYLRGPADEALVSPFPAGTKLVNTQLSGGTLTLILSDHLAGLSGMELTVACACLARTGMALTGAARVTVMAESETLDGAKSVTMDESILLFFDSAIAEPE